MSKKHTPFIIFCLLYIIFSLFTYKHFGVTTDEQRDYTGGRLLKELLLQKHPKEYFNNFSGHENPYSAPYFRGHLALFSVLNPSGSYEIYHLLNLLFGLGIFVVLYAFLYKITDNSLYSLVGPILLFFTPRFLGHIPSNPKDIPFAFFYLLGLYLIFCKSNPLKLGIVIGLAVATRVVGLSLLPIYLIFSERKFKTIILVTFFTVFTMYISLPYLWIDTFEHFKDLLIGASSFGNWDNTMLFMGHLYTRNYRPDIYLPVWFLITTPIHFIFLGLYPVKSRVWILGAVTLGLNFLAYFALKPIVYNGLRHFLYLIPVIVLLASLGLIKIIRDQKKLVMACVLMSLFITVIRSFLLHPYQYLYFNEFVGGLRGVKGEFELDYWGATYSEGAKWLSANIEPGKVYTCTMDWAVEEYLGKGYTLVEKPELADYVICDVDSASKRELNFKSMYSVMRENVNILDIGKL
ncbi:hypothetical protein OAL67_00515 [bacterium]|nr:hypothetical protein [bacterium]